MRGAYQPRAGDGERTMTDTASRPHYARGLAVAPAPAAGEAAYPTTAVPAGGMDWHGPKHWDGWSDRPTPDVRPAPEPDARGGAPRHGVPVVGRALGSVLVICLASLLGLAALVAVV